MKNIKTQNQAPFTPTFYGEDRKEKLERYLEEQRREVEETKDAQKSTGYRRE